MKPLLLFTGLLLASGTAAAQATSSQTSAGASGQLAVAPAAAAPDTVAAIHRLFAAKRKKLLPIVAGTVAADAAGVAIIGATVEKGSFIDGRVIGQALTVIVGVAAVAAEVLFYTTVYSKSKEQRAVAAFEAHQLPHHLRRQLKAKYFQ